MVHLQRLISWSSALSCMATRVSFMPPTKCYVFYHSCSSLYNKTLKTLGCNASHPSLIKEWHEYLKLCALNNSVRQFSFTSALYKKKKASKVKNTEAPVNEEDSVEDDLLEDPYFEKLRGDSKILGFIGSDSRASEHVGVLVLQPWVKWGPSKRTDTTGQLLLDEAVALVATLPGVEVVAKVTCLMAR